MPDINLDYTAAQINDSVAKRHEHLNKVALDKISEVDGNFAYDGQGYANGWSPILLPVIDGNRIVEQLSDWVGGTGAMPIQPAIGTYRSTTGYVTDISQAVDIRGATGSQSLGVLHYMYSSAVVEPPTGSEIRFNSITLDAATKMWVKNTAADTTNTDAHALLMLVSKGVKVRVQDIDNHLIFVRAVADGDAVNKGDYVEIPIVVQEVQGVLPQQRVALALMGVGGTVVQNVGQSETDIMSQKAVTNELALKADLSLLPKELLPPFKTTDIIISGWNGKHRDKADVLIGNTQRVSEIMTNLSAYHQFDFVQKTTQQFNDWANDFTNVFSGSENFELVINSDLGSNAFRKLDGQPRSLVYQANGISRLVIRAYTKNGYDPINSEVFTSTDGLSWTPITVYSNYVGGANETLNYELAPTDALPDDTNYIKITLNNADVVDMEFGGIDLWHATIPNPYTDGFKHYDFTYNDFDGDVSEFDGCLIDFHAYISGNENSINEDRVYKQGVDATFVVNASNQLIISLQSTLDETSELTGGGVDFYGGNIFVDRTAQINAAVQAKWTTNPTLWLDADQMNLDPYINSDTTKPLKFPRYVKSIKQSPVLSENCLLNLATQHVGISGNNWYTGFGIDFMATTFYLQFVRLGHTMANFWGYNWEWGFFKQINMLYYFKQVMFETNSTGENIFPGNSYIGTLDIEDCQLDNLNIYCAKVSVIKNCKNSSAFFYQNFTASPYSESTVNVLNNNTCFFAFNQDLLLLNTIYKITGDIGSAYEFFNSNQSTFCQAWFTDCTDTNFNNGSNTLFKLENCNCPNNYFQVHETNRLGINTIYNSTIGNLDVNGSGVIAINSYVVREITINGEYDAVDLTGLKKIDKGSMYVNNELYTYTRTKLGCTSTKIIVNTFIQPLNIILGQTKVFIDGYNDAEGGGPKAINIATIVDNYTFTLDVDIGFAPGKDVNVTVYNIPLSNGGRNVGVFDSIELRGETGNDPSILMYAEGTDLAIEILE